MSRPSLRIEPFGFTPGGRAVEQYKLTSGDGLEVWVLTYGAIVSRVRMRGRTGAPADVALGHDTLEPYLAGGPYVGALIGRVANRIGAGRLTIDGRRHQLATNNGPHHLHGGLEGWDKRVWDAAPFDAPDAAGVTLTLRSPAGDQGYPGGVDAKVEISVSAENTLAFAFHARTDAPTPINMTHHGYFNLSGDWGGDITDHELTLDASTVAEIDQTLLPTGSLVSVDDGPFDFRAPRRLGECLQLLDSQETSPALTQLRHAGGLDHAFAVNAPDAFADRPAARPAARLVHPGSGRVLSVTTSQPSIQVYTANGLDGGLVARAGARPPRFGAICLETQHFPDSPNRPEFPSVMVRPGDVYAHRAHYHFAVQAV